MTILEEIKRMQEEGKTEQEIASELRQKNFSPKEITEALSQSQIKNAITENPLPQHQEKTTQNLQNQPSQITQINPSLIKPATQEETQDNFPSSPSQTINPTENYPQAYPPQPLEYQNEDNQQQFEYNQEPSGYDQNYDYQQYNPTIGTDTITEISEQIVSEKISKLKRKIEKNIDLKNTIETKISSLSGRIQRIEKIIDNLQISILQKVGESITNVSDLKEEIIQTQKSFKKISNKHRKSKK